MIKQLVTALAVAAFAFAAQAADEKKPTPQQEKMATCNKEAGDKKGDERKAFMKTCLSAKPAAAAAAPAAKASPECEKSADDKKLAGAARTSHVKKCMADAATAKK